MKRTNGVTAMFVLMSISAMSPVSAETVNCTAITAVPAVITLPGIYCFTQSLVTNIASGNAVDIQANNVVLDMNGFRLGGLGAGPGTTAMGIHADNRQNITIRNGTIRGFLRGILLEGVSGLGHVVEDVRIDQITWAGIVVYGTGNIVRNSQVVSVGGTTAFANAGCTGIVLSGTGARAINNDVSSVVGVGTGLGYGIYFTGAGGDALAANNRITSTDRGIMYNGGFTGKYRDNLTAGVTTPYTGGTDAGNNN